MGPAVCRLDTLPPHLLQDILCNGHLRPSDLASLEAASYVFRAASGIAPYRFKSIAELAAHHSCQEHSVFQSMPGHLRSDLLAKCGGNWKLVLRFLQALQLPAGSKNVLLVAGKYHTLLVNGNGKLFACGSNNHGILGQGPTISLLQAATPISFPGSDRRITQISGGYHHAAFLTDCGQVYSFGDNSSCCCGVGESGCNVWEPTLVVALEGIPCQQVQTGLSYTVALTRGGEVYSWGSASHGQLGHGNTQEQPRPRQIKEFDASSSIVQISAGSSHTLAVTRSGELFSWGYGYNYGLGHDDFVSELRPRLVAHGGIDQVFVVSAVAGDEHSAAIDSLGQVYTWGKGYCGALGHGDEIDQSTPKLVSSLTGILAVQVVARQRKTFVLCDSGLLYAFGWMGYHSLGFKGKGASEKILYPQLLEQSIDGHRITGISAGMYHTLVLTNKGTIFGFGDSEKMQLGQLNSLQTPVEVFAYVMKL